MRHGVATEIQEYPSLADDVCALAQRVGGVEDFRSQDPDIGKALCLRRKKWHLFLLLTKKISIWGSLISLREQLLELGDYQD